MVASFRMFGGMIMALALICLLGFETSAPSVAQGTTTLTAQLVVDHDEFGSNRSKLINVIDSIILARDSREKPESTFSHPALAAEPDHVHRGDDKEHHDKEGAQTSCCTSAACSGSGVMSTPASLFVKPATISCRAMPLDRLIPFEVTPSERPPRAA